MREASNLEYLHKQILACRECREIFGFEPRPYVWGKASSKIMQISQAPSYSVYLSNKPFDDASGDILRKWYGIDKDKFYDDKIFYFTSISHCYPGKSYRAVDRKPLFFCADKWLRQEMKLVDNELYIIIGAVAFNYFFRKEKFSEVVFRKDIVLNNKPVILLPHPSPRNRYWLSHHPEFYKEHLPWVRSILNKFL